MKKEKRSNVVFYNLMGIMLVLFLISLVVTGGKVFINFCFMTEKIFLWIFSIVFMIVLRGILMGKNVSILR